MTDVLSRSFPAPTNWQDFERLCCDLYGRIWQTNDAQLNGRTGQPQCGVDVYGRDRVEQVFCGVQCKGKDDGYGSNLSTSELKAEVEKAKCFRPKIDVFIVATTAPGDAKIQKSARLLTEAHKKAGLFEVRVEGWTTLKQKITNFPDLLQKYFPDLAPIDVLGRVETSIATVEFDGSQTRELLREQHAHIQQFFAAIVWVVSRRISSSFHKLYQMQLTNSSPTVPPVLLAQNVRQTIDRAINRVSTALFAALRVAENQQKANGAK